MGAMTEPIQQRCGPLLIAKHLPPFARGQIARNHGRGLAVAFGQNVKEPLASRACTRDKAEFIHDAQIDLHQALRCWQGDSLQPRVHRVEVCTLALPHLRQRRRDGAFAVGHDGGDERGAPPGGVTLPGRL
jgi:hypothetical protein